MVLQRDNKENLLNAISRSADHRLPTNGRRVTEVVFATEPRAREFGRERDRKTVG